VKRGTNAGLAIDSRRAEIRREPLKRSNSDRLKLRPQEAGVLTKALVLANAPAHARKRAAFQDNFERPCEIRFCQTIDEMPDIDMEGACLYALWVDTVEASEGFSLRLLRRKPKVHLAAALHAFPDFEQRFGLPGCFGCSLRFTLCAICPSLFTIGVHSTGLRP
jgi:hypothetical protein